MCRMLRLISSSSGPSGTSNISAIRIPGKVALRVRRKKAAASRSSTKKPIGELAIQLRSLSSRIVSWKRSPFRSGPR